MQGVSSVEGTLFYIAARRYPCGKSLFWEEFDEKSFDRSTSVSTMA